ncbi:hypothetical protein HNP38_000009 [Chryseobacterium defluvii]|uniref:Uncharacterized protein n=1 Tax=Chryseobacterium defluvii TaxID=160396 RepID=A0A840K9Q1_9FLAO|nr:hypothetical protein [Chryseobacterium defluvii]MBB4804737.1 hypothetical protein [Chryseobacterium defluvii]
MKTQTIILTMIFCMIPILSFANNIDTKDEIEDWERFMALIPVILYLLISILILWKLRKDRVTLKELLLDKDMIVELEAQKNKQELEIAKLNPVSAQTYLERTRLENGSAETSQKSSISRLLAFISGLVSVGLACAITTFYMWSYFEPDIIVSNTSTGTGVPSIQYPDLDKLLTVLLSLGIGVIPYGFNKIGNALRNP